jgi:hypothetical protein
MTPEPMTAEQIKAKLTTGGQTLLQLREAAAAATTVEEAAYEQYKAANADIIKKAKEAFDAKEKAEAEHRELMASLYELTGEKRYQDAYEIRLRKTATYDTGKVLAWLLSAPYDMAKQFLTVNKSAFEEWLKDNVDSDGIPPEVPFCTNLPAVVLDKPTAYILSDGLPKLAAPKLLEPVGEPVTLFVPSTDDVQAIVASTSAEVAKVLAAADAALKFEPMGDIPF